MGVRLSGSDSILANSFTFLHLPLDFHAYLLKFREKFKDDTQKLRKFENPYESGVTKDFFDCVIELATSMPNSRFCQEFTEHLYSPLLESRDRLTDILNDPNSEKKDLSPEGEGKSSKQGRRSDRMKE